VSPEDRLLAAAGVAALAVAAPLVLPDSLVPPLTKGVIFGLAAVGFNILYNYTGLISFGHALFVAAGGYGYAILTVKYGWHPAAAAAAALLFVFLVGAAVGYLSLRHTRIYFALLTLAFGQLFYTFLVKFTWLTGGSDGIIGVPRPGFASGTTSYYYFAAATAAVTLWLAWRLIRSPLGVTFQAIRDNPERARLLGVNVDRVRLASFIASALVAGVAGVLLAMYERSIDPGVAYWTFSAELVFAALLGGASWFLGPMAGGVALTFLYNYLIRATDYWMLVLGAILVALTIFLPGGLAGLASRLLSQREGEG